MVSSVSPLSAHYIDPIAARKPVIVIGVPCYGNVVPEVLEDWMRFAYHCGRRMPQYDFYVSIRTKSEQFRARNAIVDAAMSVNADWLLMIDDDMIIDHERYVEVAPSYTFLEKLLAHDKDICGVLYYQRTGECKPVVMTAAGEKGYRFLHEDEIERGLQEVDVAGGGCLLVKMRVFDKIKQPYFEPEFKFGTDIQLCRKAKEAGFSVWADTSIELGHVREERVIITSRNRHQYAVDTLTGEDRGYIATNVYDTLLLDAEEYLGEPRSEFPDMGNQFMTLWNRRQEFGTLSDADWYKQFPSERIARQVWFNTEVGHKRSSVEWMLASIHSSKQKLRILDFGCGIGIPGFTLAQHGHEVTAADIDGTGTYEFLKWRVKKHDVRMTFAPVPLEQHQLAPFQVIIANDCLEHIPTWRETLKMLVDHLVIGGYLFANNAILDDTEHPEHYDLKPADFVAECVNLGLAVQGQLVYQKVR